MHVCVTDCYKRQTGDHRCTGACRIWINRLEIKPSKMNTTHEGAWSEPKPPTAETQDIADKVSKHHTFIVHMQVYVYLCRFVVQAAC